MPGNNYLEGGGFDFDNGSPIPPSSASGGASAVAANPALVTPSGGLSGTESLLLVPMFNPDLNEFYFGIFDYNDFDTEVDCEYRFREEDVLEGRKITVSRVRLVYRNLGIAKLTATVTCASEDGVIDTNITGEPSASVEITIGKAIADNKKYTRYFDLVVTGERPQLILTRKAGMGPVKIVSVTLITDVEMAEQL